MGLAFHNARRAAEAKAAAAKVAEEDKKVAVEDMKVAELIKLATEKGIELPEKAKKAEIIDLIKAFDAEQAAKEAENNKEGAEGETPEGGKTEGEAPEKKKE